MESIQELKLDCLEASDDGDGCVKWRSDVERQMMQPIPGRREGDVVKSCFAPLGAVLFAGDAPTVDVDMDGDTAIGGGEATHPDGQRSLCAVDQCKPEV